MKWIVAIALIGLVSPLAYGKKKPALDHVGTITHHDPVIKDLLEGRTDLYEAGDYTCTPGDEHHAPDCRTVMEWHFTEKSAYDEIQLEDHTKIIVSQASCTCDVMPTLCKLDSSKRLTDNSRGCKELIALGESGAIVYSDSAYRSPFVALVQKLWMRDLRSDDPALLFSAGQPLTDSQAKAFTASQNRTKEPQTFRYSLGKLVDGKQEIFIEGEPAGIYP